MYLRNLVLAAALCATSVAHARASDPPPFPPEFTALAEHHVAIVCMAIMSKYAVNAYQLNPVETRDLATESFLLRVYSWTARALELGATDADRDYWLKVFSTSPQISDAQLIYCRDAGYLRYQLLSPDIQKGVRNNAKDSLQSLKAGLN